VPVPPKVTPADELVKVKLIELATVALTPSVPLAVTAAGAGLENKRSPAITIAGRDIGTLFKREMDPLIPLRPHRAQSEQATPLSAMKDGYIDERPLATILAPLREYLRPTS
jgi:hypothetical protein